MAIHPGYADAILQGRKQVEFRKRPLAADVTSVLMYATSPVQRIIGEFSVDRIVGGTPDDVWMQFGSVGCIGAADFDKYYGNSETAYALVIAAVRRFGCALPLSALSPQPAIPQSFSYLDPRHVRGIWCEENDPSAALFPIGEAALSPV
jgi:predicted transcriptional regulator